VALLQHLALRDFRNIGHAALDFPAEGVVVIGDNGQGKTNLLEAIYYFQLLRSMRGARDQDLVGFGAPAFHLHARATTRAEHELSAAFSRNGRKKVVVDGAEAKRLTTALGSLPSVVLSPRDVELVIGAPSERRRYLDIALAVTSPRYLVALQTYRAALARRNAALRLVARGEESDESVAVWEPAMAESGAVLVALRAAWMAEFAPALAQLATEIGERETLEMRYVTSTSNIADARDELLAALERKRSLDIRRGLTHSGPHRDDVALTIGGRELRTFGSAGQQRTAAIALRLVEALTIYGHEGSAPVLLLDDPFAELDVGRSTQILRILSGETTGQTILAVPRASDIPSDLRALPRWRIERGVVTPEAA
jgi:DNA replication and repair protein RecF